MMNGGPRAEAATRVQLDGELTFPARPMPHIAITQAKANVIFKYVNCILIV
jgi:hypothetical protein